jgi:hypothetical protein
MIRGEKAVNYFKENQQNYAKEGKYLTYDYNNSSTREFVRIENMDGHKIKTIITITPPQGGGSGGAVPTNKIKVYFDEKLIIDTHMGHDHYSFKTIPKIIIHTDDKSAIVHLSDDTNDEWVFDNTSKRVFQNNKLTTISNDLP